MRSSPAEVPPNLPFVGTFAFDDRVQGREGDLLIVQMRSGAGLIASQRNSLRTLGLKGVGSLSLRRSSDENVRGLIRSVGHVVAVLQLGGVYSKEQLNNQRGDAQSMQYERPFYGTNTQPAQLVRDLESNYFQCETSRRHVLLKWNTAQGVRRCLEQFGEAFGHPTFLSTNESIIGLATGGSRIPLANAAEVYEDGETVVVDTETSEATRLVREDGTAVRFARIAFRDLTMTWRAPRQKFEDRELVAAEVGVLGSTALSLVAARTFADATGSRFFFQTANCEVQIRQQGNLHTYPF